MWLVTLIIQTGTVSLRRLAGHGDTRAKPLSVHRRFERFFQHVHLDEARVARMIVHIMGLSRKPWHLALDRTNWKFDRYKTGLWLARIKPPRHKSHGRLQRSLFALGLNASRKAMLKMTGPEIVGYMKELLKPKIPRKALIGLVL